MFDTITLVRLSQLPGFIIANIVLYFFFDRFISDVSWVHYFLCIFISFVFLKTDFLIWIIKHNKKNKEERVSGINFNKKSHWNFYSKFLTFHGILIFVKQIIFNALYELFPIFIIWLSVFGVFYIVGTLKDSPREPFYQLLTIFGILMGIFQFYLQRQEGKVAVKLDVYSKIITQIINEETSFDKFYEFVLNNEDKSLKNWIDNKVQPKFQVMDMIKILSEVEDLPKLMRGCGFKSRGKSLFNSLFNLNINYQDSNQKYTLIETEYEHENKKDQLIEAYNEFFLSKRNINSIISKIEEEVDLNEFGLTALNNLNIFSEVLPQFANLKFKELFESVYQNEFEEKNKYKDLTSHKEFRATLNTIIMRKILRSWISVIEKKSHKENS
jgi:hypothetical protein